MMAPADGTTETAQTRTAKRVNRRMARTVAADRGSVHPSFGVG
jgi:hypothetical protein